MRVRLICLRVDHVAKTGVINRSCLKRGTASLSAGSRSEVSCSAWLRSPSRRGVCIDGRGMGGRGGKERVEGGYRNAKDKMERHASTTWPRSRCNRLLQLFPMQSAVVMTAGSLCGVTSGVGFANGSFGRCLGYLNEGLCRCNGLSDSIV